MDPSESEGTKEKDQVPTKSGHKLTPITSFTIQTGSS